MPRVVILSEKRDRAAELAKIFNCEFLASLPRGKHYQAVIDLFCENDNGMLVVEWGVIYDIPVGSVDLKLVEMK